MSINNNLDRADSVEENGNLAPDTIDVKDHHSRARYFATTMTTLTAVIYFMIGFNIVSVLDTPSDQIFGIFAGLAYALGVLLMLALDRRVVWVSGSIFQVFVIAMYFNLATKRSPDFEFWGIALRVVQMVILVTLVYLTARTPQQTKAMQRSVA
ncbi:MAG: hypothetical protein R3E39_18205 [Anaerolineae bacterium]